MALRTEKIVVDVAEICADDTACDDPVSLRISLLSTTGGHLITPTGAFQDQGQLTFMSTPPDCQICTCELPANLGTDPTEHLTGSPSKYRAEVIDQSGSRIGPVIEFQIDADADYSTEYEIGCGEGVASHIPLSFFVGGAIDASSVNAFQEIMAGNAVYDDSTDVDQDGNGDIMVGARLVVAAGTESKVGGGLIGAGRSAVGPNTSGSYIDAGQADSLGGKTLATIESERTAEIEAKAGANHYAALDFIHKNYAGSGDSDSGIVNGTTGNRRYTFEHQGITTSDSHMFDLELRGYILGGAHGCLVRMSFAGYAAAGTLTRDQLDDRSVAGNVAEQPTAHGAGFTSNNKLAFWFECHNYYPSFEVSGLLVGNGDSIPASEQKVVVHVTNTGVAV